jgi:hypothetical protein
MAGGYYFVMAAVCLVSSTVMIFVLPETARLTLEIAEKCGETVVVQLGDASEKGEGPVVDHAESVGGSVGISR